MGITAYLFILILSGLCMKASPQKVACNETQQSSGSCTACNDTYYGPYCNQTCVNCSEDEDYKGCNFTTGRCNFCHWSMYGEDCNLPCPAGCAEGEPCDRFNGSCLQCKYGHEGPFCCRNCKTCSNTSICLTCDNGYHESDGQCVNPTIPISTEENINTQHIPTDVYSSVWSTASDPRNSGGNTNTQRISTDVYSSSDPSNYTEFNTLGVQKKFIYYIIAAIATTLLLATTVAVVCFCKRKHSKQSESHSLTELECNLIEKQEKKTAVERGPNSTYNLRGSVGLLTEIDHTAPIGSQPQPKQVSSDYFNVRFFKISIKDLDVTVQKMKETDKIFTEFQDIPSGLLEMYDQATRQEVMKRNRYKGIFPFNHSRVILTAEQHKEVHYPEYINACFIHGFRKENAYIAAQGPFTNDTIIDFWRMIWQKESKQVVMLTNIIEGSTMKCLKYWPDEEEVYGPIHVKAVEEKISSNFIIRSFLVYKDNDERRVTQYHFTAWPDKGVPSDSQAILEFRAKISNDRNYEADNAMIVHCSAGIGRTGTFIALDSLLIEGTLTGQIDVINCVSKMRQQRVSVIQTPEQYVYLYETLAGGLKNVEVTECLQEDATNQTVNQVKLLGPKSAMPLPINEEQTSQNGSLVAENLTANSDTKESLQNTENTISQNESNSSIPPNATIALIDETTDKCIQKPQNGLPVSDTPDVNNDIKDGEQTTKQIRPIPQNVPVSSPTLNTVTDNKGDAQTTEQSMSTSEKADNPL